MSELEFRYFPAGTVIFKEGHGGRTAFLLQEGKVEISRVKDGETQVLAEIGPNSIFGEMALIDDKPRSARARAIEDTNVVVITEEIFQKLISRADPFLRQLITIFARNLRNTTRLLAEKVTEEEMAQQEAKNATEKIE